ncbi:MAG: membrane protein insertion efficiency factor YidD [Tissierellia bacterium]|nr:membrane protein insertion efficiency factor YidD [Tissierellia bacterium]
MKKIAILLIRAYQKFISPLMGEGKCKFVPTCSEYAMEAFQKYPFFKALRLSIGRILRCNPFNDGGYDPLE